MSDFTYDDLKDYQIAVWCFWDDLASLPHPWSEGHRQLVERFHRRLSKLTFLLGEEPAKQVDVDTLEFNT